MQRKTEILTLLTFVVALFAIYLQIFPPQDTVDRANSLIYFLAIVFYTGIFYVIYYYSKRIKGYIRQIQDNTDSINKIKDDLKVEKIFHTLEKRISLLEALKNKKAEIDPLWVLFALLLVLFYLYLRSLGLVP